MSVSQSVALVNVHLDHMEQVDVHDAPSAHKALGHATAAVAAINESLQRPRGFAVFGPRRRDRPVVDLLNAWVERLLERVKRIVAVLAEGVSFSLSVGTTISLTINFPPIPEKKAVEPTDQSTSDVRRTASR